jgi:hypothetical protein
MFQQAGQLIAQKTPQPPIDPAVQKTFEAAMAEVQRKILKRLEEAVEPPYEFLKHLDDPEKITPVGGHAKVTGVPYDGSGEIWVQKDSHRDHHSLFHAPT